jgi:hypothetical protein
VKLIVELKARAEIWQLKELEVVTIEIIIEIFIEIFVV